MHKFLLGVLVGIVGTVGTCLAVAKIETTRHSFCNNDNIYDSEKENDKKTSDSINN